jgi:hypothetical protein
VPWAATDRPATRLSALGSHRGAGLLAPRALASGSRARPAFVALGALRQRHGWARRAALLAPRRALASSAQSERLWEAYILLNLTGAENLEAVKRAYYVSAVRWHPDRAGGSTEKFQRVKAAYEYIRDERLGKPVAHPEPEPARRRPSSGRTGARAGARRDEGSAHDGWGARQSDNAHEPPPDYTQGPRTKKGRWIWKIAMGYLVGRVFILLSMKLALGDQEPELALRAAASKASSESDQDTPVARLVARLFRN